jgi:secreted PhoX family phosphatase
MGRVLLGAPLARAQSLRKPKPFPGYGELIEDPKGILDLPKGFSYRVFSREGDAIARNVVVPASHDGMAAFRAGPFATWLVRNHEISAEDVEEDGIAPVSHVRGATYDPEGSGGTTTLLVGHDRRLLHQRISLAGTENNCAGGPTPWQTWLTCEEDDNVLSKPHGYVFEVDPVFGGNPVPIVGMGRFEHEAVAFDSRGRPYLTEDADSPFGCIYRFIPRNPLCGNGSLHAGGTLSALAVEGLSTDLSAVQTPGTVLPVRWIPVPNPNPGEDDTPVREQVIALGATQVQKAEGIWTDKDGSIWFVSSRGGGPGAEDEEDRSAAAHGGQIFRYDPKTQTIELVVVFASDSPFDGPDNITVSPYGYALACTDGEDDQWLVGINEEGTTFPFAFNPGGDDEFAGATFSPNGDTLFVNLQSSPALTFAIWGPFGRRG